jgi:hypothetical protein
VPDLRLPLTDKNVAALPPAAGSQYIARDAELAGFFVLTGIRRKSFMIQGDLRLNGQRQSIRMKIANVGDLTAREARAKAKTLLGAIADGIDPREKKRTPLQPRTGNVPTLRDAWERWKNGPAIANGAMRSLRAIYNHARKTCRQLPAENPTFAVDWNPEQRRDTALGVKDLPDWFEQLAAIPNPIRREFHLLTLLSGCRPEALKNVALTDLDLASRFIHIRKPKGGEEKAFEIPLSRAMLESILRLRRLGRAIYPEAAKTWLFPSDAPSGHVEEHKEDRAKVLSHWGNDLRQSFRTLGQVAGVSDLDCHLLMNHSIQGVNPGYITRSKLIADHLRQQQEKISQLILGSVVGRGRRPSALLSRWLNSTSRALLSDLLTSDPDAVRAKLGARSALRKMEVQAARCDTQRLDPGMLDAPSRRLKKRYAA